MSNVVNGIKEGIAGTVSSLFCRATPEVSKDLAQPAGQDESGEKTSHPPSEQDKSRLQEGTQVEPFPKRRNATATDPTTLRDNTSQTNLLLNVPTYDDEAARNYTDRQREASRHNNRLLRAQMAKVHQKYSFKATNTLNNDRHHSNKQSKGTSRLSVRPSGKRQDMNSSIANGRIQAKYGGGSNVKSGFEHYNGETVEMESNTRPAKRQRIEKGPTVQSQQHVQLIGDDDDNDKTQADHPVSQRNSAGHLGGQRTTKNFKDTANSFQQADNPYTPTMNKKDLFGNHESRNAHQYLSTGSTQRKRGARGSQSHSSKAVSQSPGPTLESLSQNTSFGAKFPSQSQENSVVMLDDKPESFGRRDEKSGSPLYSPTDITHFKENANYLVERLEFTSSQAASEHQRRNTSSTLYDHQRKEERKPRARQRMQVEQSLGSKVSPVRYGSEGEDELHGGNTTLHRGSAGATPNSHRATRFTPTRMSDRSVSPSDITPTNFRSRKAKLKTLPSVTEEPPLRIPIKELYSRGFVGQKGLELVWDDADKVLYVEEYNKRVESKGRDSMVYFSASEFSHWIATDPERPVAYIKGSATQHSMGKILVLFENEKSLSYCLNCLIEANNSIKVKKESLERMDCIWANQVQDIQKDFHMYVFQKSSHKSQEAAAMEKRHAAGSTGQALPPSTSSKEAGRSHASSRMQAGESRLSSASPHISLAEDKFDTKSRYFESGARRSTRNNRVVEVKSPTPEHFVRWTEQNPIPEWEEPITYPILGKKAVTVEFRDLERLDDGEFLNDNLVNFGLRQIQERMSDEVKEKVHFFNTYFYSSLLNQKSRGPIHYEKVKRWTRNVDLFSIPYVVIPFNLNLHWFVAIICNLPNIPRELEGVSQVVSEQPYMMHDAFANSSKPASPSRNEEEVQDSQDVLEDAQSAKHIQQHDAREGVSGHSSPFATTSLENGSVATDSEAKQVASNGRRNRRNLRAISPDKPIILTLDSFGSPHATEVRNVKAYLAAEAREKRGMFIDASGSKYIQGITAKGIPEQTNFCDCGVFLIEYIDRFAKNPREFIEKAVSRQMDVEGTFGNFDPSTKRAELREALLELDRQRKPSSESSESVKHQASNGNSSKIYTDSDIGRQTHKTETIATEERPPRNVSPARSRSNLPSAAQDTNTGPEEYIGLDDELEEEVPRVFQRDKRQTVQNLSIHTVEEPESEDEKNASIIADDDSEELIVMNTREVSSEYLNSDNDTFGKKLDNGPLTNLLKRELRNQAARGATSNQVPGVSKGKSVHAAQWPRTLQGAVARDKDKKHHIRFND